MSVWGGIGASGEGWGKLRGHCGEQGCVAVGCWPLAVGNEEPVKRLFQVDMWKAHSLAALQPIASSQELKALSLAAL